MTFDRTDKASCRPWKRASSREAHGVAPHWYEMGRSPWRMMRATLPGLSAPRPAGLMSKERKFAFNGTNEPGRRVCGSNPTPIFIGYACRSKSLTARYGFTCRFRLAGPVESATVGGTRCGLTQLPLAIGAHLQTRRMLVSPGRSSGPVVSFPFPISCLAPELPGRWSRRCSAVRGWVGGALPDLLPTVGGAVGLRVVVEALVSKMRLGVNG